MESASNEVRVSGWNTLPQGWMEAESPFHWFKENEPPLRLSLINKETHGTFFIYEDIKNSLMNYKTFSSELLSLSILAMDPPKHKLYRSIVSKAFTPKIVEEMAPMIEQVTNELLDSALKQNEMDFILDFAYPLPVIIISEMLGCLLLLVAGNETTTNLLGNTMKCILEIPGLQQQLHHDPATRKPNQHMAFGVGPHFCLGAPLSRLEAKIAFDIIFERISTIEDVNHSPAQFIKDPLVHSFKTLPIQF